MQLRKAESDSRGKKLIVDMHHNNPVGADWRSLSFLSQGRSVAAQPERYASLRSSCNREKKNPRFNRTAMIIRVFRAHIRPGHHAEFERKFREVSLPLVLSQPGVVAASIGRPVSSSPDEFVFLSTWTDTDSLCSFVGNDYTAPVIPSGMEQHMITSWVHHYEVIQ
jgi:heme oxygenase (mycobilin-producing)